VPLRVPTRLIGPTPSVLSRFAHVRDDDCRVGEVSGDFKRAAERFDVASEVAYMHVSTLFQLRDGRLANRERFRHFLLREGTRLAQLLERHCLAQRSCLRRAACPALRCEILGQLVKGLNPSFLISSMYVLEVVVSSRFAITYTNPRST
jgi:hypothetical protein